MRRSRFLTIWLLAGFAFLYVPMALMVAISFNNSRLTTEWTGFSLRWYVALAADDTLMQAAWLSLRVAVISATLAMLRKPGARQLDARLRLAHCRVKIPITDRKFPVPRILSLLV